MYNRRALDKELSKALYNLSRYNQAFSIVLFDLDHFKTINDTYGHDIGDKVLVETSQAIATCLRETDFICRYGGEEFIVLLYGQKSVDGCNKAESCRQALNKIKIETADQLQVSASFGVVNVSANAKVDFDQLLVLADKAMYEAKQAGRNCVMMLNL